MAVETAQFAAGKTFVLEKNGPTFVYAGCGRPISNEELLAEYGSRFGEDFVDEYRDTVNGAGIDTRYISDPPFLFEDDPKRFERELINFATALTQTAMAVNGWKSLDYLVLATSMPPDKQGRWIEEVVTRCSVISKKGVFVSAACNSGLLGLYLVLQQKELAGKKVAVAAFDLLSNFVHPDDVVGRAIFGNGGGAIAFDPANFKLLAGKTIIVKDPGEAICAPSMFDPASLEQRLAIPSWLELGEGAEEVFSYTDASVTLALPKPKNDPYLIEMNGMGTAKYFSRLVPPLVVSVLEQYYKKYGIEQPIPLFISHQPSAVVFKLMKKVLAKSIKEHNDRSEIKIPDFDLQSMPWVLDRAHMSNVSAGTTHVALAELAEQIATGEPFMALAYGVGASVLAFIARYIRQQ